MLSHLDNSRGITVMYIHWLKDEMMKRVGEDGASWRTGQDYETVSV